MGASAHFWILNVCEEVACVIVAWLSASKMAALLSPLAEPAGPRHGGLYWHHGLPSGSRRERQAVVCRPPPPVHTSGPPDGHHPQSGPVNIPESHPPPTAPGSSWTHLRTWRQPHSHSPIASSSNPNNPPHPPPPNMDIKSEHRTTC